MAKRRGFKQKVFKRKRKVKRKGRRSGKRRSSKFSKVLQSLRRMKQSQRTSAIRNANDKFIRDIVSHVRKLRTRKLPSKMMGTVKKNAKTLRFLSNPKVSLKRKRHTLSQKGGLHPILALLAPVAGAVLSKIINR